MPPPPRRIEVLEIASVPEIEPPFRDEACSCGSRYLTPGGPVVSVRTNGVPALPGAARGAGDRLGPWARAAVSRRSVLVRLSLPDAGRTRRQRAQQRRARRGRCPGLRALLYRLWKAPGRHPARTGRAAPERDAAGMGRRRSPESHAREDERPRHAQRPTAAAGLRTPHVPDGCPQVAH